MAISCSLLNRSLILECATTRAVAQITIVVILQEVSLSVLALEAFEGDLGALFLVLLLLGLSLLTILLLGCQ